jgi:hypothetical protein
MLQVCARGQLMKAGEEPHSCHVRGMPQGGVVIRS